MAGIVLLICATAVDYRFHHPDMLAPLPPPAQNATPRAPAGMNEDLAALMRQLAANPGNAQALLGLAEHFLRLHDWAPAERFARRALTATPGDIEPHYLLSKVLHGMGRNEEAAASLEQALQLKEVPALRYSLGILYARHLNNTQKALAHLRQGLANPAVSGRLKADLEEELAKLEQ